METLPVKVAAYQAPLLASGSMEAIALIREQVDRCEAVGVEILCCPEGVLGGLADYALHPAAFAIDAGGDELDRVLAPLASHTVTTIVGFTEIDRVGRLYNSAAVFRRGSVAGLYRKLHPAINRSVYSAGDGMPVFTVGELTFGIVICRDSTFAEPARTMASRGATALFVPTNNGLPPGRAGPEIAAEARNDDVARATENRVSVIRADVTGRTAELVSWGSSGIVDPDGQVLASARPLTTGLLIAEIETTPRGPAEPIDGLAALERCLTQRRGDTERTAWPLCASASLRETLFGTSRGDGRRLLPGWRAARHVGPGPAAGARRSHLFL